MNSRFVGRHLIIISFVHSILQAGTHGELTKGCATPLCGTITLPNGDIVALEPKSVTNQDVWWPGMDNIAAYRLICKLPDCLSTPCRNGGTCTETFDGFNCTCITGFYGPACEFDLDECSVNQSLCDTTNGVCTNMPGTFKCSCNAGYELDLNGSTCNDINECNVHSDLCDTTNGVCTNMPGTFYCSCNSGYELDVDRSTCNDLDECSVNPSICDTTNGVCTNMPGTFKCSCNAGYELDVDGSTCNAKCPDESWLSFQGSCYGHFTSEVNFYQAMSTCRGISNEQSCKADLVSIHSEDEMEFIHNLCLTHPTCSSKGYWIGFYQPDPQGPFVWSDGTPVDYTAWKWPEPNNAGIFEDCTFVYRPDSSKLWTDDNCYGSTSFICKVPVVCN